jgi:DNA-binding response OmpR family regulator
MRAVSRRHGGRGSAEVSYGALVIDPAERAVRFRGKPVVLSTREFAVLEALMRHPGLLVTRERLVESVYGWGEEVESNAVEVHLHHLRRKLCADLILNVRGVGYRLVPVD